MSHELYTAANGKTSMAYVGEKPWHGLGQELTPDAPIEVWSKEAGMNFEIHRTPVAALAPDSTAIDLPNREVLYRNDTNKGLAVVSPRYRVVQPLEVLEFFGGVSADLGYTLETAGVLYQGATYWALAKTPFEAKVGGVDAIRGYLMLSTSCDGSMSTAARFVNTRVVCNNTLRIALGEKVPEVRVTHRQKFDASKVRSELGLTEENWNEHTAQMGRLAETRLTDAGVERFLQTLFPAPALMAEGKPSRAHDAVRELFMGGGIGAGVGAADGTAWGLLNAVTEFIDHKRGYSQDARLSEAWFGGGASIKQMAAELLLEA